MAIRPHLDRLAKLQVVARAHDDWIGRWLTDETPFTPHGDDSDYNLHYLDVEATPTQEVDLWERVQPALTAHLPGKHNQDSHGRGEPTPTVSIEDAELQLGIAANGKREVSVTKLTGVRQATAKDIDYDGAEVQRIVDTALPDAEIISLEPAGLRTTQKTVTTATVRKHVRSIDEGGPITVVENGRGRYIIRDGNHRAAAAHLRGMDSIKAHVIRPHQAVVAHLQGKHDQKAHGRGGVLNEGQYAALDPSRKRSIESVKKSFNETPEGKRVFEAITSFTSRRGGVSKVRDDIDKMARGEDVPEVSRLRADAFLSAMTNYPGDTPTLHRGMAISTKTDEEFTNVLNAYEPGKTFDLNVTSFSSSPRQAETFGNNSKLKSGEFIRLRLVMDGANALPVENASKYRYEKEWLTAGRFRVKERRPPTKRNQYYEIHIEQTETL